MPSSTIDPTPDRGSVLDARVLQMVDQRRTDTLLVDTALADGLRERRARAVLAIANVKMRARYPALRRLLTDSDTLVAATSAYALGVARDTGALAALAQAVERGDMSVASEAAWALGELGEPARATLVRLLGSPRIASNAVAPNTGAATAVRAAVVLSTVKLRPVPVELVVPFLADAEPLVGRAAAYVIGRQRLAGGVRALAARSASSDEETRQHVARGLARQAAGDSLAALARDALRVLVRDDSPRVRANAARSIVSYGPSAAREVESALDDRDANVRAAASEGLQSVFLRDSIAWRRAWSRDTTFRVRQQLLMAARAANSPALADAEREWTTHADWRRRAAALDARASEARADLSSLAKVFARDADVRVRSAALGVLPATAKEEDARALVEPALSHNDAALRASALAVLTPRARASDIGVGLLALRRAESDREGNARASALRLIASAWRRDSVRVDSATRRAMLALRTNASLNERRLVANVTPMQVWARAGVPEAARSIAEYERVVRTYQRAGARQPRAVIHTERGQITMELFGAEAPLVVEAFVRLASEGFYRNTLFHRVVPNFVAQDGDPRGDGSGGPGFVLRDHHARRRHDRGALGLATSGPDTGGSQYYLCHSAQPHLDGGYTVFGRVIEGFEVMDAIVQGDRMLRIEITS
ncbi:MAG: peptidylprolyl isomerase [Gemmatimonadaceae bacterium]|nr:peptidylprolyl isomerase [Gemmatimonadaceae bacterium]